MNVKIIASTKENFVADKESFDRFSGRCAGVCYMASTFEELATEDVVKTEKRVRQTKLSGHHSVYDHNHFSLYFEGIPKIIAMLLNNENQYTTSEKSGRYTRMELTQKEELIYNKWLEIFKNKITKLYKSDYPQFFTDSRIEKLAQENARYITSVFTPVCMIYTTTYRQFNIIIALLDDYLKNPATNAFETRLHTEVANFVAQLKALPYYDEMLCRNEKQRHLSFFSRGKVEEYFGDVYSTTYHASFSVLAHLHRHRTINYSVKVMDNYYYIPEIIRDSDDLSKLWLDDLKELNNFPQATMLEVNELGTLDNFVLKMKERMCSFVLLETNRVTSETWKKYVHALQVKVHPRAEEMLEYTKGSRCTFPDYTCPAPCGFPLGINEKRII